MERNNDDLKPSIPPSLAREMEAALLEYVERYGLTDRARDALIEMAKHRTRHRSE